MAMIFEIAIATFTDGYRIEFTLTAGPGGERSWALLCRSACHARESRTGQRCPDGAVLSVRVRESGTYPQPAMAGECANG
jgi:hypothetical protein